jgi:hypothetical protein
MANVDCQSDCYKKVITTVLHILTPSKSTCAKLITSLIENMKPEPIYLERPIYQEAGHAFEFPGMLVKYCLHPRRQDASIVISTSPLDYPHLFVQFIHDVLLLCLQLVLKVHLLPVHARLVGIQGLQLQVKTKACLGARHHTPFHVHCSSRR